ncbi:haloacid dehalogenase-like hydrolase [Vagococcus sp. BWB3-3]|uniref:Haloacid dehalogenase-like hydrolase n=1 Tax=Vagococcus allomyrinae TaxID=2794353 RepID=A0A940P6R5_9ENTE|nr:haloacid dehalogenase-like hydrolase [Vagococcus allomyrinae]
MKRLLNCTASETRALTKEELVVAIKANAGRTILAENDVVIPPFSSNVTNSEVVAAFGADLILLNCFDFQAPVIIGLDPADQTPIKTLKKLTGKPIGVNLEPVDGAASFEGTINQISPGRIASDENLKRANEYGFDFICLTGNPSTGVSNKEISDATKRAKGLFEGVVIAGKMHSAGVSEAVIDMETIDAFAEAGADIILVPTSGTVPGFTEQQMHACICRIHQQGKLAMSTIGTTQEGADTATIRELALMSKRAGADIQHIGDAGFNGTADPENIMQLSVSIRGKRHTYLKMAQSINR